MSIDYVENETQQRDPDEPRTTVITGETCQGCRGQHVVAVVSIAVNTYIHVKQCVAVLYSVVMDNSLLRKLIHKGYTHEFATPKENISRTPTGYPH